jgi:ribose transport system ATP-binding protein
MEGSLHMKLEMLNIVKSFGANDVLKDVDFNLSGGEVVALLGENGAGKSTLMNILGGVVKEDSGRILIDGKEMRFVKPLDSLDAGIGFIHQDLNLIDDLAVYENMFINRELKSKYGFLDIETMCEKSAEIFQRMDVKIDPKTMVRELDASYKQIVEIARALMMEAQIIIMDEPTTSLTAPEIKRVFAMMETLKEQGVGMVFISHKLKEVLEICDRYCVLRDGDLVAEGDVKDVTVNDLAKHMVGHEVRTDMLQRDRKYGKEVLRGENLTLQHCFKNIDFAVQEGEVLGFTGLLGDGRSELFRTVFGCNKEYRGKIFLENNKVRVKDTKQALNLGIGYLPRNRKENGIIGDMNILENGTVVIWPRLVKNWLINRTLQREEFQSKVEDLRIKLEKDTDRIGSLSGGNQQKVVLAKWLSANPKVLILDNPTQGVDVGAKEDIYDIILDLADAGMAVIVLSSEAQEIIRVCDRALVMYHGEIKGQVSGDAMTEENIMLLATGGQTKEMGEIDHGSN